MTKRKRSRLKDFTINKQLFTAIAWLRANKVINSHEDICKRIGVSKATMSAYHLNKRPVSGTVAYNFEEAYLRKEALTLQDFQTPALLKQAMQLQHQDTPAVLELLGTEVIKLEGGVQVILEKLDEVIKSNKILDKRYGELLKVVKKIEQLCASQRD